MLAVVAVPFDCLHSSVYHSPRTGSLLGISDAFQKPSVGQGVLDVMCIPTDFSSDLALSILQDETEWEPV